MVVKKMKSMLYISGIILVILLALVGAGSAATTQAVAGESSGTMASTQVLSEISIKAPDADSFCGPLANPTAYIAASVEDNTGTGRLDPFLTTFTPKKDKVTEEGINAYPVQWETFDGGDRTHLIQLADVPKVDVGGKMYYEFDLDANEAGNDNERYLSIGEIRIFVGDGSVSGYDPSDDSVDAGSMTKVWDLQTACGPEVFIGLDYRISEGSGWSDMSLYVPVSAFGDASGTDYVYMYTLFANPAEFGDPTTDYTTNDGFEEWGLREVSTVTYPPLLKLIKVVNNNYDGTNEPGDWELCADGGFPAGALDKSFCYLGDTSGSESYIEVWPNEAYTLSENPAQTPGYIAGDWSCVGNSIPLNGDEITLLNDEVLTCTIVNSDFGTPVPEFPTLALPVAMVIGLLGAVLFIRQTKDN
jgi:hypothetical protein